MNSILRVCILVVLASVCATTQSGIESLRGALASVADRLVVVERAADGHPIRFHWIRK